MKPLSRLNRFFWKYKYLFVPGLLCAVASAVFSITVPMIVRRAVDSIPHFIRIYQSFGDAGIEGFLSSSVAVTLLSFGVIIILLSVLSGVFSFLMRQTVVVASRHIEFDMRNELYDHLQRLSRDFYIEYSTGDLITRSTSDIEQVRRYMGPAIMYLTRALVIVVTALVAMLVISPRLTLFAVIPMPFLAVSVFVVARLVHVRSDRLQKQYSSLTSRVQEALAGIRVVKAYTRERSELDAFSHESSTYRQRMLDLALVNSAFRPVFIILIGLSTIIVVLVGGRLVVEGQISLGNIAEYIIYVALMTWPVAAMGFVITMIQQASASVVRLGQVMDAEPSIADSEETDSSIESIHGSLEFRDVGFHYTENGPPILDKINLGIEAGKMLAIVGRTGSGKSTLVSMIPRLVDPSVGRVLIDGTDVRRIPLTTLRQGIGYVPQEVFLFSDSIGSNIEFGDPEADPQSVELAAAEAELLENIIEFPEKFETQVGERGIAVSGGQKQRASIARALIRNPRILVLDDALSAVDTKTERAILRRLQDRLGECTIVIVSHRVSAVLEADLIAVIDEGRIIERGSHAELIEFDGAYANLYRKQLLEQEIEALN
ncbi:MAG: ABC transporter ATP-binding protein [Rhodothermales bacterium]|nr:ABC transporter ATP-binding protein [Rhodothermales bacterium]